MFNVQYEIVWQLESVIQQELEGLNATNTGPDCPPNNLDQNRAPAPKLKPPSLPEPTGPPPPPPLVEPETPGTTEPIYESVLPRSEENSSPPPLPAPPHKLRPKSPSVERVQQRVNGSPTVGSPRPSRPSSRASNQSGVSPGKILTNQESSLMFTFLNLKANLILLTPFFPTAA